MKNPWVIVGLITVILSGGAIWYSSVATEKNNEGISVTEHVKGNPEAEVTLVEYSDFQCPACASFQPVVEEIMNQYGDKIRFEYKHFPLPIHQYAQQAAVAAEAAGQQGKFFEFHDMLFKNQQTWAGSVAPTAMFAQYAEELGLDVEQFKAQQKSTILRDHIRAQMGEGRELGITGTPTFYLNGEKMEMNTFEEFISQIAMAVDPEGVATAMASSSASTTESTGDVKFGF